jgi:hypothetical protein
LSGGIAANRGRLPTAPRIAGNRSAPSRRGSSGVRCERYVPVAGVECAVEEHRFEADVVVEALDVAGVEIAIRVEEGRS